MVEAVKRKWSILTYFLHLYFLSSFWVLSEPLKCSTFFWNWKENTVIEKSNIYFKFIKSFIYSNFYFKLFLLDLARSCYYSSRNAYCNMHNAPFLTFFPKTASQKTLNKLQWMTTDLNTGFPDVCPILQPQMGLIFLLGFWDTTIIYYFFKNSIFEEVRTHWRGKLHTSVYLNTSEWNLKLPFQQDILR